MSKVYKIFYLGLRQVLRDGMLLFLLPAPFLMGAAFHYLLPLLNSLLEQEFNFSLSPWYAVSDALLIALAPVMTAMICAFIILDERDEGVGVYYKITPAGRYSYLIARIGLPMIWAFVSSVLVTSIFAFTVHTWVSILFSALIGTMQGVVSCMLLVAIAGNKVEGLALAKLANLFLMGFLFAFMSSPFKYIFAVLPSFWLGELIKNTGLNQALLLPTIIGVVCCLVWIVVLQRLFLRRVY